MQKLINFPMSKLTLAVCALVALSPTTAHAAGSNYGGGVVVVPGVASNSVLCVKTLSSEAQTVQLHDPLSNASIAIGIPSGVFSATQKLVVASIPTRQSDDVLSIYVSVENRDGVKVTSSFREPITLTVTGSKLSPSDHVYALTDGVWHELRVVGRASNSISFELSSDPIIQITKKTLTNRQRLSLGSTGQSVKLAQSLLNSKGFHLSVDGIYGPMTKRSVVSFQRSSHLTGTGVINALTWAGLTSTSTRPSNLSTVQVGAFGSSVSYLQLQLVRRGYSVVIDGRFGPNTRAAVVAFQLSRNLLVDGIVGPATWSALIK